MKPQFSAKEFLKWFVRIYVFIWIGFSVWAALSSKQPIWKVLSEPFFLISPVVFIVAVAFPVAVLIGTVIAFRSRKLGRRWKILISGLIVSLCIEGFVIWYRHVQPVQVLGIYHFYDMRDHPEAQTFGDSYVSVRGSWKSDTNIAAKLQTTELQCWRDKGICIEATAMVEGGYLKVFNETWEIAGWDEDEIRTKDKEYACVVYTMRIDRKNKIVTQVRTTKKPKPPGCEFMQDEPIFLHLR